MTPPLLLAPRRRAAADNEDRTVQRRLLPSNPAHAAVMRAIREVGCASSIPGADFGGEAGRAQEGGFRGKAYYHAVFREDGALAVQFAQGLPRQAW